jgi:hypothetical protein
VIKEMDKKQTSTKEWLLSVIIEEFVPMVDKGQITQCSFPEGWSSEEKTKFAATFIEAAANTIAARSF